MQQERSKLHLYSRKVLIKESCQELLPSYLRFIRGVVDCEDLPLNISRETYQDSSLITNFAMWLLVVCWKWSRMNQSVTQENISAGCPNSVNSWKKVSLRTLKTKTSCSSSCATRRHSHKTTFRLMIIWLRCKLVKKRFISSLKCKIWTRFRTHLSWSHSRAPASQCWSWQTTSMRLFSSKFKISRESGSWTWKLRMKKFQES